MQQFSWQVHFEFFFYLVKKAPAYNDAIAVVLNAAVVGLAPDLNNHYHHFPTLSKGHPGLFILTAYLYPTLLS
jgi:hypothetical protein